jgi:bifunctional non-homologous end joining protein LigD
MRSETLYCQDGSADKVYTVTLESVMGEITVVGYGGRRGGTMKAYPKYKGNSVAEAESAYQKLLREKLKGGYTPGADAAPMADGAATGKVVLRESMYKPMLLNSITQEQAKAYINDPAWLMQEKHDGVRAIVDVDVSQALVQTASRNLLPVALTAEEVKELLAHGPGTKYSIDVEVIGPRVVVLDLLSINGTDLSAYSCEDRCRAMDALEFEAPILTMTTYTGRAEKTLGFAALSSNGAEGVVFKRRSAPYQQGRPNTGGDGLKCKFKATASLKVIAVATGGKDSIDVATSDGRRVASCSTIGKKVPTIGSIVEVEYLYAHHNGGIIQAIYLSIRKDKNVADSPESLQYKGEKR